MPKQNNAIARKPATGQMGIFLVVAIIAAFLVIMASTSGMFRNTAATHVVLDRRHLQAYYAAKAGINEAIGTRMIPRTNYLSFIDPRNAFYRLSGVTRQNPNDPNSPSYGIYRYFILGGDESRDGNTGQFWNDYIKFVDPTQYQQNYYIISQGSICVDNANKLVPGIRYQAPINPGGSPVVCPNPQTQRRVDVTMVAAADLTRNTNKTQDVVSGYTIVTDPTNIPLPHPVYDPSTQSIRNTVNFEQYWSPGSPAAPRYATPKYVIVQNSASVSSPSGSTACGSPRPANAKCIFGKAITSNTTTIQDTEFILNPTDVIEIFFDQAVDYRTYYIGATNTNGTPSEPYQFDDLKSRCFNDLAMCRLTFNYNQNYPASIIPFLPSSSGVRIYPPTTESKQIPSGTYTLLIRGIRTYKGDVTPDYTIRFRVVAN